MINRKVVQLNISGAISFFTAHLSFNLLMKVLLELVHICQKLIHCFMRPIRLALCPHADTELAR